MGHTTRGRSRCFIRAGAVVVSALVLSGCDGDNLFTGPSVTGDMTAPSVTILEPTADSVTTHTIGEPLLVSVLLSDNRGVDSVLVEGFAIRGNVDTGLDEVIPRFESQTILLEGSPVDTTVTRALIATADGFVETVQIVTTAWDEVGNFGADTVSIFLDVAPVLVIQRQAADARRQGEVSTVARR